jgi:hypothetical protein
VTDLRDQLADFDAAAQRALTFARRRRALIMLADGHNLGPLLRNLRHDVGLTLDEVGRRAYITRKGVCNRELHGVALPAAALIEHANALGYDLALVPREDA